jgi:hypothetical protein
MWCFDICIYYKMITTLKLIDIFITLNSYFSFMVRTFKIYSLSTFKYTSLTIVTILGNGFLERIPSVYLKQWTHGQHLSSPFIPWQPQFFAPISSTVLDSIYKWDHLIFFFLCLAYVTYYIQYPPGSSMLLQMTEFLFKTLCVCVCVSHFLYSLICLCTIRLVPYLGYYE